MAEQLKSHKPFESGIADWLMESKKRLDLTMGEFVAEWGDVETIRNHLKELAHAEMAANTPGSIRNKEENLHKAEVWAIIIFLADMLQNSPDAAKLCARLNRNGVISTTRQQPFHPTAGILWPAAGVKRCDSISEQRKRKNRAERLFWGEGVKRLRTEKKKD